MDSNLVNHPQPNNVASTNPPEAATSHASSDSAIELSIIRIAEERLRQAGYSFDLALVMTAASAIIGFVGVGLLLSGQATEGTITATGGLASSVRCLQLARDANNRLDKIEASFLAYFTSKVP